jgi:hypothetical protein
MQELIFNNSGLILPDLQYYVFFMLNFKDETFPYHNNDDSLTGDVTQNEPNLIEKKN